MEEKEVLKTKICSSCLREKSLKSFTKCKSCNDGYRPRCTICVNNKDFIPKRLKVKLNSHDHFGLNGLTSEDWKGYYQLMRNMGYDISKDIHEQFMMKYGLPLKPKKKLKGVPKSPEEVGLSI